MLDTDTKRRIDNARNVLVGKVPDPKAQVEQITIALIYKFMDDMDQQSVSMGGEASFFTGEFAQYAWHRLMSPALGGHERLNLYMQALMRMDENPGLPALFRAIFKNAYLPYNAPDTLNMFLKEIDGFVYDHSERLGDAFEYLLMVLGSQGDAGQFRTPRHIIEFIVDCVNPTKGDRVLDPACGTAGFLIAAYKHILAQHGDDNALTGEEKAALMKNFTGYDISPDMVRLALVNLYLHQFPSPGVYEYDTLSSEERWDEYAEVILANPPFMTPKGGIIPHKRFSISVNKSEVLFVDYIAEHLTSDGRAGIIVPEGIIFQSSNAYKSLRKMLVEEGFLYAVVSLPTGVFNPYSGVKTSILLLDRKLAKRSEQILFVKVENDGFDLGAQRNPIAANDLPAALRLIQRFQQEPNAEWQDGELAIAVKKDRIAEDGDYNLTGDRYRVITAYTNSDYRHIELREIAKIQKGSAITRREVNEGFIPVIAGGQQPAYFHSEANRNGDVITVSSSGAYAGFINFFNHPIFASDCTTIQSNDDSLITTFFLYKLLKFKQHDFYSLQQGMGQPHVYGKDFEKMMVPLPPLAVQEEIVAEIEGYQRVIDGARQVVEAYQPRIPLDPDWPMVELGELCIVERGGSPRPIREYITDQEDGVNWVKIGDADIGAKYITQTKQKIKPEGTSKSRWVHPGDFILSNSMSFGRPYIMKIDGCIHDGWLLLSDFSSKIDKDYLYHLLGSTFVYRQFELAATGGVVNNLNSALVRGVKIPLPPIESQRAIVAQIEEEQALVDANRRLIDLFEAKIERKIAAVWGE